VLALIEKIVFIVMAAAAGGLTAWGFINIYRIIRRGRAAPKYQNLVPQAIKAFLEVGLQKPISDSLTPLSWDSFGDWLELERRQASAKGGKAVEGG